MRASAPKPPKDPDKEVKGSKNPEGKHSGGNLSAPPKDESTGKHGKPEKK